MAKLSPDVRAEVDAGFAAPVTAPNPHLWSSAMWEAWTMGRYLNQTGRSAEGLEKGRGSVWRTAAGGSFRVKYGKAGLVSISREG